MFVLCRSVFLAEVLAKGEVPRAARDIWKQRSRWAAAAHMYILTPSSVFWRKQKNMSYWQKSLYWIPMVLHWTLIWAEPIMFTMPIICLAGVPSLIFYKPELQEGRDPSKAATNCVQTCKRAGAQV